MSTPERPQELLQLLVKSELFSREELTEFVSQYRWLDKTSATEVADDMIERGLITRFQSAHLLEGQFRGLVIDHYRLQEILGAGGMGWVFLADDARTRKQVALKILSERHRYEPGMLARFQLEAAAGNRLDHPNIVKTYGVGKTEGLYGQLLYFVMEYVEGVSVQELVTLHGPLPCDLACSIVRQTANGLDSSHRAGLIHRDIKPANLLVERTGVVKILDFGLALLEDEQDDEFSLAMIFGHDCIGSADYMAPEQSQDSFNVDCRADIYSLGCTLYYALSGVLPFPHDSTAEKLEGHRTVEPPPIAKLAKVPPKLAAIVASMMSKSPEDRPQSAAAVTELLVPFARRRTVNFDFSKILDLRSDEARRRMSIEEKHARGASSMTRGFESTTCWRPSRTKRPRPKKSDDSQAK